MNDELEKVQKETIVAYFNILPQNFPGGCKRKYENSKPWYPVFRSRFESENSHTWNGCADHYTAMVGNLVHVMTACAIYFIVCVVQWTMNKGRGDVTHSAPHISSLHGWLLALYRGTNNACLPGGHTKQYVECVDPTGNSTSLLLPALRFSLQCPTSLPTSFIRLDQPSGTFR